MDYLKDYDETDPLSIEKYAQKLIGKTFADVCCEDDIKNTMVIREDSNYADDHENKKRKGGLGEIIEERFFHYQCNNDSRPDFDKAGVELSGTNIVHTDNELASNANNNIENAKTDSAYSDIAAIEKKMLDGETGSATYDGIFDRKVIAYTQIEGSDNWSLAIVSCATDFLDAVISSVKSMTYLTVFILIGTFLLIYFLSSGIAKEIRKCTNRLTNMAEGDMSGEPLTTRSRDELGVLVDSTNTIIRDLTLVIQEIAGALGDLSEGNLADASCSDFKKDFEPISKALKQIITSLNQTISRMSDSSEHVASGANAIADAATSLSQGSTEQAAAVEELHETLSNISRRVRESAEKAKDAKKNMEDSGEELDQTHEKMKKMTEAMVMINSKSTEIGKIIKTIEDIAFQTNILALNAAVEASRAGSAGKGFAVVADEVRNLATKSTDAAKNTSDLIEETLKAIKTGSGIADDTSKSLDTVVESSVKVNTLIQDITEAAVEEAEALEQVSTGVAQISNVVMTNSATAQESAAASETLSEQAKLLREMVRQFKFREV